MNSVDKETFAYWVTHPHDIGSPNLSRLEATAQAYPYCQIVYTLMAKVAAERPSPHLSNYISQAAITTLNRGALRRLIENEFSWSPTLPDRRQEQPQARSDSRDYATPYGHDKPISLIRLDDRFTRSLEYSHREEPDQPTIPETPPVDDTVATEKVIEDELTQKRLKVVPPPAIELIPVPNPKEDERRKQQQIIEAFIKNDPRIGPIRVASDENEVQNVDLSHRTQPPPLDGLVTESFAGILIRQGKINKAIDIYEKLILKNPEKKDYFANKIAELKSGN
jgi:hypothetical protein